MRPAPDEVLHFSEDPTITRFVPHVARTASHQTPYVWAVDADSAPSYWFPRQCPRVMAWRLPASSAADVAVLLGPGGSDRVHAIEPGWLPALLSTELFAYRFARTPFRSIGPHAWVSTQEVVPLGPPVAVGSLLDLHAAAGIEIRVLSNLWPLWDAIVQSTLGFSGIRLHNATPRPPP
ncbi:MAG: DUF6886 family protein [Acidimicrobiales bacterium]